MSGVVNKLIHLTWKNLRIRASSCCLSFCELIVPLFFIGQYTIQLIFASAATAAHAGSNGQSIGSGGSIFRSESHVDCFKGSYSGSQSSHYTCGTEFYFGNLLDRSLALNISKKVYCISEIKAGNKSREAYELCEYIQKNSFELSENDPQVKAATISALTAADLQVDLKAAKLNKSRTTPPGLNNWISKRNGAEKGLEDCIYSSGSWCDDVFAAIVITDIGLNTTTKKFTLQYKIRMPLDFRTDKLLTDLENYETERKYAEQAYLGEYDSDDDNSYRHGIYRGPRDPGPPKTRGFLHLQAFFEREVKEYIKTMLSMDSIEVEKLYLVRMPHPSSKDDTLKHVSNFFSVFWCILYTLPIFSLMKVNGEKTTGFKEFLRMHGVSNWIQWMAWLLSSILVYGIWTFVLALLLGVKIGGGVNILPIFRINLFLFWILTFLFAMALSTFCFLVSIFFEKVWTACSVGLVAWIILMVVMIVVDLSFHNISTGVALVYMFIPTVAFQVGFKLMLSGAGEFSTMTDYVDPLVQVSVLECFTMLVVDSIIFMTLTMYLDNILPSNHGVAKPPWYIFRASEWGFTFTRRPTQRIGIAPTPLQSAPEAGQTTGSEGADKNKVVGEDKPNPEEENKQSSKTTSQNSLKEKSGPSMVNNDNDVPSPFEAEPTDLLPTVVINNLTKSFGLTKNKKKAVNQLNAKVFQGEIFALLGHNGAGKTTTISILTGMTSPTSGFASVLGLNVSTDMELIRKKVGFCPQHNLLFDDMTVLDQVILFGKLKGLKSKMARQKAIELLSWLALTPKLKSKPSKLSGGQKRRVHLAIALIGDTQLAFLDEPTSGLDPETRREVWDILFQLRGSITLIITTHHMEEADALGDRIGIMAAGKMICCGTPSFLKKYYGTGYNLKMSTGETCHPQQVLDFASKYVPGAKLNSSETGANESVLSISLPTADLKMSTLADLMGALSEKKGSLGVDNIGLSASTMDEVFIKAGESVEADHENKSSVPIPAPTKIKSNACIRAMSQFAAVFLKNFASFIRAPFGTLVMIAFFCTFLAISLISLSLATYKLENPSDKPRTITLKDYSDPYTAFYEAPIINKMLKPTRFKPSYQGVVGNVRNYRTPPNSGPSNSYYSSTPAYYVNMEEKLQTVSEKNFAKFRKHYIIGAGIYDEAIPYVSGYYQPFALHSPPLSMNLLSRAKIKYYVGVDSTITLTNQPFKSINHYKNVGNTDSNYLWIRIAISIVIVLVETIFTSKAILLPIEERHNMGKHLQLMTGVSPIVYWLATFTWDMLFITVLNMLIVSIFVLVDVYTGTWIFTNHGGWGVIFLVLESFSFGTIWFGYLLSWAPCIKAPSNGFVYINMIAMLVGIFINTTTIGMIYATNGAPMKMFQTLADMADGMKYIFWIFPVFSLYKSFFKLIDVSIHNSYCYWYPIDMFDAVCDAKSHSQKSELDHIYLCCSSCKSESGCHTRKSYWETHGVVFMGMMAPYKSHGLPMDILSMICCGVMSAVILFVLEYMPAIRAILDAKKKNLAFPPPNGIFDTDVLEERSRVEAIIKQKQATSQAIVAYNLRVNFKNFMAVQDLSFGINHGECFGLLGVNGAGKTTTFRVLVGDLYPTLGRMHLGRFDYYTNRGQFLASIGYCPQFEGLIGNFTGREMVMFYGALRGVPWRQLRRDADIWLDKFGLNESAKAKCKGYSGGMKRRLSTAMALVGSPKILLLDEPTTGVDPVSRRQFWQIIKEIRESGQSVILTSHTMDECEALCNRLGIMVNGQFQCLGDVQHLKSKYGKGFSLDIKLKRLPPESNPEEQAEALNEKILSVFNPCTLKDQHSLMAQYQISNTNLWYSDMFRSMEEIKSSFDIIDEYFITESSLEDIFISFARQQVGPNLKAGISKVTTVVAPQAHNTMMYQQAQNQGIQPVPAGNSISNQIVG